MGTRRLLHETKTMSGGVKAVAEAGEKDLMWEPSMCKRDDSHAWKRKKNDNDEER